MSDDDRRGPEWFEEIEEFTDKDMKRLERTFWLLITISISVLIFIIWWVYEAMT